jgi:hypothetical protein
MVGRYRNPKGITFETEPIKIDPHEIDFDRLLGKDENIYVLAHQPGIGKTYSVMRYLRKKIQEDDDFSFFYFTDRHATIDEHTANWDPELYSHWEGFDRICENSRMRSIHNGFGLSPTDICHYCRGDDTYLSQFRNSQRVFAPFEYLNTPHFQGIENPPDIIFLDENIKKFTTYSNNLEQAERIFQAIRMNSLADSVAKKEFNHLSVSGYYETVYDRYRHYVLQAIENKDKELLELINGFNLYNFFQYVRWEHAYGYGLESYGVPELYYGAFQAVTRGIPAVFMDATFNRYLFQYLLECYNAEAKIMRKSRFKNLNVSVYKKYHRNSNTILYRMRPEHVMPKASFFPQERWERTKEWFSSHMKIIMDIFGRNHVGIITFKDFGDIIKSFGYDAEYFGNLRGTNVLENKPVLVIVGTYLPIVVSNDGEDDNRKEKEDYKELLQQHFLLKIHKNDLTSVGFGAPKGISSKYNYRLAKAKGYVYVGKGGKLFDTPADEVVKNPAETLNNLYWYDEIYQAFHRNRGLRKDRIIFSYCWFPEPGTKIYATDSQGNIIEKQIREIKQFSHNLRDEFAIDKIDNDIVNTFFDLLMEIEPLGKQEHAITYALQNPDVTTTEMATRYRVFKKGEKRGLDTHPVTMLRRALDILGKEAKRPE